MTSINDLPNELLDAIFRILYEEHWKRGLPFLLDSEALRDEGYWLDDPFDPSMFPFAQAKVCRRWCALLAYYPRYWTRIPIVVNPATTPHHHVPNYLTWSRDLPIEVFVKSHTDVLCIRDLDEKSYIGKILPSISQHLYHVKTIQFSLHTCIPNLSRWLVGSSNLLESIKLSPNDTIPCTVHDHNSDLQDDGDLKFRFSAPNLASLTIDWRTFVQACHANMSWLDAPNLWSFDLVPSGPHLPTKDLDLSVGGTIQTLAHACPFGLRNISVRNIPFANDAEHFEPPGTFRAYLDSLTLEGLKGTEVATFVTATGTVFGYLAIKNCSLLGLSRFTAYSLQLEDFNEDSDFTEAFGDAGIYDVAFCNCPAFNDTFIEFMTYGGITGEDFPARGMRTLFLEKCTNFSVEYLYHMIRARRTAMEASPLWDGTEEGLTSDDMHGPGAIGTLEVVHGPPLSKEYRTKFGQLVPRFCWTD